MVTKLGPLCKVKLLKNKADKAVVRSPEKAGVGGSTPSLATILSITCIRPQPYSCSILFQRIYSGHAGVCLNSGSRRWVGSSESVPAYLVGHSSIGWILSVIGMLRQARCHRSIRVRAERQESRDAPSGPVGMRELSSSRFDGQSRTL